MTDLQPWEQRFRGKRWSDMPGDDSDLKKIHFALWRRGLQVIIEDGTAKRGFRLGGSLMGTLPSLSRNKPVEPKVKLEYEQKPTRPKRQPGPQGLPAHMVRSAPLKEVVAVQKDVARVAKAAGLTLSDAARMLGIRRTAFSPSEVVRSSKKILAHMKRFLEIMEERS